MTADPDDLELIRRGHRRVRAAGGCARCTPESQRRNSRSGHPVGTREEWRAARLDLLKAEKEL
ncbi:MAG TPA: hypothetical protein VMU94_27415, partial [Streptosporangiaceae bacterium]|nr:hypothetical protein [Streptosporangiaceae bacterium]